LIYTFKINVTWQFATTLDPLSYPKELSIDRTYGFIENIAAKQTFKIVPTSTQVADSTSDYLVGSTITITLDEDERAVWFKSGFSLKDKW